MPGERGPSRKERRGTVVWGHAAPRLTLQDRILIYLLWLGALDHVSGLSKRNTETDQLRRVDQGATQHKFMVALEKANSKVWEACEALVKKGLIRIGWRTLNDAKVYLLTDLGLEQAKRKTNLVRSLNVRVSGAGSSMPLTGPISDVMEKCGSAGGVLPYYLAAAEGKELDRQVEKFESLWKGEIKKAEELCETRSRGRTSRKGVGKMKEGGDDATQFNSQANDPGPPQIIDSTVVLQIDARQVGVDFHPEQTSGEIAVRVRKPESDTAPRRATGSTLLHLEDDEWVRRFSELRERGDIHELCYQMCRHGLLKATSQDSDKAARYAFEQALREAGGSPGGGWTAVLSFFFDPPPRGVYSQEIGESMKRVWFVLTSVIEERLHPGTRQDLYEPESWSGRGISAIPLVALLAVGSLRRGKAEEAQSYHELLRRLPGSESDEPWIRQAICFCNKVFMSRESPL